MSSGEGREKQQQQGQEPVESSQPWHHHRSGARTHGHMAGLACKLCLVGAVTH